MSEGDKLLIRGRSWLFARVFTQTQCLFQSRLKSSNQLQGYARTVNLRIWFQGSWLSAHVKSHHSLIFGTKQSDLMIGAEWGTFAASRETDPSFLVLL